MKNILIITLVLSGFAFCQLYPNRLAISNGWLGGEFADYYFPIPGERNGEPCTIDGQLLIYNHQKVGTENIDTLYFLPDCFAPLYMRSLKFKRNNSYYFSLDSFTKQDSINGHWGATPPNTTLRFDSDFINNEYSTYLKIDTKAPSAYAGRRIFHGDQFWKALDTTLQVIHKDTIELILFVPPSSTRNSDAVQDATKAPAHTELIAVMPGYVIHNANKVYDIFGRSMTLNSGKDRAPFYGVIIYEQAPSMHKTDIDK